MTQYTSLFVLVVALSGALSQFDGPPGVNHFDCRRKGISCTNGTCDTVGTTCSCDLSFTSVLNYHCVDSTVETTTCTDPAFCHNGGECRVVGGADTCFCPQHFTGTNCELPRLELTCDSTAMTVTVRPHGLFQGRMYANEQASDSNCLLSNADQAAVFENTFAYDPAAASHCGVAQSDLLAGFGTKVGTKYELSVIVQYSLDIITGQDQMLVANCSYPDLATAKGVIFEADATYLDPGAVGGEGSTPLVFDILGKTGSTLTAGQTVNVGDALTVTILLPTNAAFPEFLVDSCTAANGDDDTAADYESLKFVTTP
ncbi:EGF-like domain-containing protein 1 [Littorina saxatilis]|uniref:EGF-like domain-containing protein 1 n=1 Tax=Littorina saxatilis TaxID=31220 RepID=UPI0038B50BB9